VNAVSVHVEGFVATIRIERPESGNALSVDVVDGLLDAIRTLRHDPAARAVVLTGAGTVFCAGGNLRQMNDDRSAIRGTPRGAQRSLERGVQQLPLELEQFDKPVIAAVNGAAAGAGLDLAAMCDLRFAAVSARFIGGYVRAGRVPADGGAFHLTRIVGLPKALEIYLGGEPVDAPEALRLGLVNRVVDDDRLLDEAVSFATRVASFAPVQVQLTKRALYRAAHSDLRASLDLTAAYSGVVASLEDSTEALQALAEKRRGDYHDE